MEGRISAARVKMERACRWKRKKQGQHVISQCSTLLQLRTGFHCRLITFRIPYTLITISSLGGITRCVVHPYPPWTICNRKHTQICFREKLGLPTLPSIFLISNVFFWAPVDWSLNYLCHCVSTRAVYLHYTYLSRFQPLTTSVDWQLEK